MIKGAAADLPTEFSSPACSAHEASDSYMGFAESEEIVAFLNRLLEAERAGALVAFESARQAAPGPIVTLLWDTREDETKWGAMLLRHLRALGATPSSVIGEFHAKAMAIPDRRDRILFLNHGQEWVVKNLRRMLPRIRDDRLHADLQEMLAAHAAKSCAQRTAWTTEP